MALLKDSWLAAAQALGLGHKARVEHDCGPGRTLIIEHKQDGWSAYCYRCSDKGWHPKPIPTLAEKARARAAQEQQEQALRHDPRPPQPAVFDVQEWPLEARVWLFKAGLFVRDIAALGAYYHPPTKRVVLPVVEDGRLTYWQARDVGLCPPGSPKYINPEVDRSRLVCRFGEGDVVVLTEDILSAYRVGLTARAWAIMGTKLPSPILAQLIASRMPVLVWLDNDPVPGNPGQTAAANLMRTLECVGIPCANIVTEKDAKALNRAQVTEVVNEFRHIVVADHEEPKGLLPAATHS